MNKIKNLVFHSKFVNKTNKSLNFILIWQLGFASFTSITLCRSGRREESRGVLMMQNRKIKMSFDFK